MDVRRNRPPTLLHFLASGIKITIIGALALSLFFASNQIKLSDYFLIKTVRVYGLNHLSQSEVQDSLMPLVNRGFFSVKVEKIRDRLRQMSWVSDLYVRRIWPDQIEITIVEKQAIARWNHSALLSRAGDIFTPREETYAKELLPNLIGPSGKQVVVLEYFNEINRLLMPLHVKISRLELTTNLTWRLQLDNGIMLHVGHKDVLTRLSHFVKVYPKIVKDKAADVDYVDLRYSNGLAVRWKETINT